MFTCPLGKVYQFAIDVSCQLVTYVMHSLSGWVRNISSDPWANHLNQITGIRLHNNSWTEFSSTLEPVRKITMNCAVKGNVVDSWRVSFFRNLLAKLTLLVSVSCEIGFSRSNGLPFAEMVYFDISLQSEFTYRQGNVFILQHRQLVRQLVNMRILRVVEHQPQSLNILQMNH